MSDSVPPLEFLACPACRNDVRWSDRTLVCERCGEIGRLERGVVDCVQTGEYAASFGKQWEIYRHTQLDSKNGTTISRDRFSSITGWSRADLEGKSVLDAGSGSGRFTEIAASLGARVTSIDLSVAAYVTRANVPSENVNVVRGNLLEPPLRRGSFDKVFSIGVLQHTPDPLGVARMLMELVKPGGEVAIWMYEKRWSTPFLPRMVLRRLTRRLPTPAFMPMTKALVSSFSPVARVGSHAPGRRLKGLIRAALPIASYWDLLPLDSNQQREWSLLDTHDWLTPTYDTPQTYSDLEGALRANGCAHLVRRPVPGLTVIAKRDA